MFPRLEWLFNLAVWVAGAYAVWVAGAYAVWVAVSAVLLFV